MAFVDLRGFESGYVLEICKCLSTTPYSSQHSLGYLRGGHIYYVIFLLQIDTAWWILLMKLAGT